MLLAEVDLAIRAPIGRLLWVTFCFSGAASTSLVLVTNPPVRGISATPLSKSLPLELGPRHQHRTLLLAASLQQNL